MSLRLLTDSFSYFKVDRSKTVTFVKNNCSFAGRSSTAAKTRSTTTMPKKSEFKSNQSPKSVPSACGTLKSSSNEEKKFKRTTRRHAKPELNEPSSKEWKALATPNTVRNRQQPQARK